MADYVIRRLLQMIPTLLGVLLITFFLTRVTGDPARMILGIGATEEAVRAYRDMYGLNDPVFVQFGRFLLDLARGNLGQSIRYKEPVSAMFLERLPATLELGFAAYSLAIITGVPIGVFTALRWNSPSDRAIRVLVLIGQAVPGFYLGLLAIILFAVRWRLLPSGGRGTLAHLILPAATLSVYLTALIIRFTRSAMLDVLRNDYIRTARAKGLAPAAVHFHHALRNAAIPLLTVLAAQTSVLFSGAVVTETVFAWPGIGRFAVEAIYSRDFPVIQGTVLIVTTIVLVVNLLVDVSYAYIDPRIRFD